MIIDPSSSTNIYVGDSPVGGAGPVPTNHDRFVQDSPIKREADAADSDSGSDYAKIIAIESATSLSTFPRQAHITPLTLFSDHALMGPLGASLLPRSPPPPLTPHLHSWHATYACATGTAHVGPAGLPVVSPTSSHTRLFPPAAAPAPLPTSASTAPAEVRRARRESVSSSTSSSSLLSGSFPKRQRKSSIPANFHHHPYRRTAAGPSAATATSSVPPHTSINTIAAVSSPADPNASLTTPAVAPLLPVHQLAANPARNRHPKHLALPASGPHASTTTLYASTTTLYASATTFTTCAVASAATTLSPAGAGARKRPRAISTPATFAALRGSGPAGVAVGPIEAWAGLASARAFLTSACVHEEQMDEEREEGLAGAWGEEGEEVKVLPGRA